MWLCKYLHAKCPRLVSVYSVDGVARRPMVAIKTRIQRGARGAMRPFRFLTQCRVAIFGVAGVLFGSVFAGSYMAGKCYAALRLCK